MTTSDLINLGMFIVAVISACVAITVSRQGNRIQLAQARTDVKLKLVDLRLAYASFNRRIAHLQQHPPSPMPVDVASLLAGADNFLEYERRTAIYHQVLSDESLKISVEEMENQKASIGTLLKTLADDNERLDDLLNFDGSVKLYSAQEQFSELRQRVLNTVIANNLPVELHALRALLIHKKYTDMDRIQEFSAKWLSNIAVIIGEPVLNVFSAAQIEELKHDLSQLEI